MRFVMLSLRIVVLLMVIQFVVHVPAQERSPTERSGGPTDLASLDWLVGRWRSEQDGRVSEEFWTSAEGGMMLGINRTIRPGKQATFENLRIENSADGVVYCASPGGGDWTTFLLKKMEPQRVVFENPSHDFPQRIIYVRHEDELIAQIGTMDNEGQTTEWRWKRVAIAPTDDDQPKQQRKMHGLRTVVYKVSNLDEAKSWYAKAFDIEPYFDEPYYVGFNVGGYELGLDPDMEGVTRGNNQPVYWGVDDCHAAVARLIGLGAKPDAPPKDVGGGVRVATVQDPFGNILGLIQNPHFKLP